MPDWRFIHMTSRLSLAWGVIFYGLAVYTFFGGVFGYKAEEDLHLIVFYFVAGNLSWAVAAFLSFLFHFRDRSN